VNVDDQILPAGEQPAAPAAPVAAANVDARFDRLEQAMMNLAGVVESAATRLTGAPVAGPPRTSEEFLNDLAANPQDVIQRVAADTFRKAAQETLNPAVLRVLDTASHQVVSAEQMRVDAEFGMGTFDELIRPKLEAELGQLRGVNPQAVADPATVRALVDRHFGGENFDKLSERRRALVNAQARGLSYPMPGGGAPRLRGAKFEDEIPPDVEQFLRDVERNTGESVDRKSYTKSYHTGQDTGPGRHRTTILEYARAHGADPDTIKSLGG